MPAVKKEVIDERTELTMRIGDNHIHGRGSEAFLMTIQGEFTRYIDKLNAVHYQPVPSQAYIEAPTHEVRDVPKPAAAPLVEPALPETVEPIPEPPKVEIDDTAEWTNDQDAKLMAWRLADHSFEAIGEALKRSGDACNARYNLNEERRRIRDGVQ
jgi:hypothetical protein